ncbi:hypothetical protein DAPPUDRAFT_234314 [Daphnia pulex]|uniref:RRM domain-containing protein n=1 Tax=Daphnia pulex TaxID=6669 RepID=E9FWB3_DAPPU|nr:hypothetical protein DAPPUDRAFT_234314 [Daphnia pulex]|eukprot:EFX87861.1 hypothetical protein DAPPUDRAFT_234314 [Daphnia pulex]
MHCILDWLLPYFLYWMGCFIDDCIESTTKSHQRAVVKSKSIIQPGTRKGNAFTTKPLTNNDNIHQENNRTLIRKLAENSNVAAENKILKAELAKLEFELALSNNKNRQFENEKDEWVSSQTAMETKILTLEQENLRLIEKESESSRVIEAKDRLLESISFLSSDNTAADSIDQVLENNLTGFEDKNTEVLRLLAESKMETSKPSVIQQASSDYGNPTAPINVSYKPNDEILVDELHHRTSDSMDDVASPPAASSSFTDTNEEDDDIEYQFLMLFNLPRSVRGEDIVRQFEVMVGAVENYTMFADRSGNYSGIIGLNFVYPPDARRAYKIFDGMFFEGHNQKVEVRYIVNGKRSYQKEEDSVPVTEFEADWIKAINASPPIDYATTVSEDLSTTSSQQNSCFPIAEPLPGKKRAFEDVVGRAIPPSVRKLLPSATSSNRSAAAEQPTNASEIKSVTNGRSLSVSRTYGRPVSSSRLGCSSSKIPVRVSNGPFAAETEPNETKNTSTDVSSESRPSVKTVLPPANVAASKIPVRVANSKQIVTSELQQSLADNKLKSRIPVRSTRSSAERQAFNKVVHLQKSDGSSCGLACNCRSSPSIGSRRGRNVVK